MGRACRAMVRGLLGRDVFLEPPPASVRFFAVDPA